MSDKQETCFDAEHLAEFLSERLNEVEESSVVAHLDECQQCQKALEDVAADGSIWSDLKEHFSSNADTCDLNDASPRTQILNSVKEFLGPTDHPDMLGRLGPYEVCGVVGRGSTGVVLKAFETRLNRFVAIKVLSPNFASNGSARVRFEREARAVAAVAHEHVIPIFAVDEFRNLPYLVMQYAGGGSLQQRVDSKGPLDPCEVVRIGMQVASGLAAAHEQGIVHRDVKPANVMLESGVERAMVTDFGLARVVNDASLTRSGVITGTPQFMSPEQAKGEYVDHRSDLFSLGSLMYAACTGRPPFRSETVYGVIRRVCETDIRPIREINPDVPAWLEAFVSKLCSKDREQRFQTAVEVRDTLSNELAHMQSPVTVSQPKRPWMTKALPTMSRQVTASPNVRTWTLAAFAALAMASLLFLPQIRQSLSGRVPFTTNNLNAPPTKAIIAINPPVSYTVFESTITRAFPVDQGGRLKFSPGFSHVTVLPSDCDQLEIRVKRKVSAADETKAAQLFAMHGLHFAFDENGVVVSTNLAQSNAEILSRLEQFEVQVYAPKGYEIEIDELESWQELTETANTAILQTPRRSCSDLFLEDKLSRHVHFLRKKSVARQSYC